MRKLLQALLLKPVLWAAGKFSSKPDRQRIFQALSVLKEGIMTGKNKKGLLLEIDLSRDKFILFSDQHKGAKDGADDFKKAEPNYLFALQYYFDNGYKLISLGDSEELWENSLSSVKKHNQSGFEKEKLFVQTGRFVKLFGNHDLYWDNDPFAFLQLEKIYHEKLKVYEGVILRTKVKNRPFHFFLTHGHQGDKSSDGNWFSKFFVARIWAPLQAYLGINPNTPAYDQELKTEHNHIMYEWSALQKNLVLITGHTHQPVFESLTHLERLHKAIFFARAKGDENEISELEKEIVRRQREYKSVSIDFMTMKPGYFNCGCCCFSDGDMTGIEIADNHIRLVKWKMDKAAVQRHVLEEENIEKIAEMLI